MTGLLLQAGIDHSYPYSGGHYTVLDAPNGIDTYALDINDKGQVAGSYLEPISKSFEEDNEAGKLDKAKEIVSVVLPTNEYPALPLNPDEEALDEPAPHVAA